MRVTRPFVLAALAAGAVLLAGCAGPQPAPQAPVPAAIPAATASTPAPTTTTTPPDERTPAQRQVDDQAAAIGYVEPNPSWYPYPHMAVEATCETLAAKTAENLPAGTWLSRNVSGSAQLVQLYKVGFPLLCPEHTATLDAVLTGAVPFGGGTLEVGAEQGKVKPGRWRNVDAVDDCYWERTAPNGGILDNQFATHAKAGGITVTIRPSDGSFTSEGCGIWERVG